MNINEYDNTIDNAMFLSKIDNIYVMLCMSIMKGDISQVNHKISDNLYNKYTALVNTLNANNERQMFDELNIKSTTITNIVKNDQGIYVDVTIESLYLDYIIDKTSFKYLRGNNTSRTEHTYHLSLFKSNDAIALNSVRRCPTCGSSLDVSFSGKCTYCGTIFNTEKYDYVLMDIDL